MSDTDSGISPEAWAAYYRWIEEQGANLDKDLAFVTGWHARDEEVAALLTRAESAERSISAALAAELLEDIARERARAEVAEGRATKAIAALWEIVNHFGHVCDDFGYETCRHRSCDDSLNAWLAAHRALKKLGLIQDGQSIGSMTRRDADPPTPTGEAPR